MLPELIDLHEQDEPLDLEQPIDDPLIARRFLIELAILERKRQALLATQAAIQGEYSVRGQAIADRIASVRDSLANFVQVNGKVSFPDAGGCSLTQRSASVRVVKPEMLAAYLLEHDQPAAVKTEIDLSYCKTAAKDAFAIGELLPGCEVEDEPDPTLTVRGVKS